MLVSIMGTTYAGSSESKQPRLGGAHGRRRRRLLQAARAPAGAGISVDRLLRQPGAGQRDRRPRPGELFVHRNVANLAPPQDANYLSVLQFAVDVIKVKHIMVVGHYGCGGVSAAVDGQRRGLVDHWLHPIREVFHEHRHELDAIPDERARLDRLCELNVIRQVRNVASDVFVQDAWARGQDLCVHGWVYSLANGLVTDLDVTVSRPEEIERLR